MRRFPRLTVAAAAIACWAAPSALAAGSQLGYAVSAVGFKSYFIFDARVGHSVRGRLKVASLTPGGKTIIVSPVDVSTAATGGLQYGNHSPHRDGRWLEPAVRRVRISGSGSAMVPFTVHVPTNAGAGDHLMALIALDRRVLGQTPSGRGSLRLRLIPRLAMTVLVRLPGRRTGALRVGGAKIEVAPSGASVALDISNPGNTLIPTSTGTVTVSQDESPLFTRSIDLAAFVPKTAIAYRVPWDGTPVEGTYRVKGEIRPAGASAIVFDRTVTFGRDAIRQFRADTGRAAKEKSGTPVLLIVALALAMVAAFGFGVAYVRARRRMERNG